MRLEYRIRYLDRLMYSYSHQFLSPVINGFFVLFAIFIFATELKERSFAVSAALALFVFIAMWLAQLLFLAVVLLTRRSDSTLTDHVLELQDDGIYDTTQFHQLRVFWNGIQRVVSRPGLVAIYVAQHSAMLIPNRAFGSPNAQSQFIAMLTERLRTG
jgi:phosphotransferase system  glucose/maltose/N-acetylglucosamine-specific IIC component